MDEVLTPRAAARWHARSKSIEVGDVGEVGEVGEVGGLERLKRLKRLEGLEGLKRLEGLEGRGGLRTRLLALRTVGFVRGA